MSTEQSFAQSPEERLKQAGARVKKPNGGASEAGQSHGSSAPEIPLNLHWADERAPSAREYLVKDMFPARGVCCLAGQSGMAKSFAAIDLALSIAGGMPFAGRKVRRAGVFYLAAEGAGDMHHRIEAARRARSRAADLQAEGFSVDESPFCWADFGSGFTELSAGFVHRFANRLASVSEEMQRRYGVRLGVVIIDTMAAAGLVPPDKENDAGAMARVVSLLNLLSRRLSVLVIVVHHYGKSADSGLRGSSALRAGFDTVLAFTGIRDETTGSTRSRQCALTKCRYGREGPIGSVHLEVVEIGTDEDGDPITSCLIHISTDGQAGSKVGRRPGTGKGASALYDAVYEVLNGRSAVEQHVHGRPDGRMVRTAALNLVRPEFEKRYATGEADDIKRRQAVHRAWRRVTKGTVEFCTGTWAGKEWIWLRSADADREVGQK
jgi:hypothetical protein